MIAFIDDQRAVHGVEPICKLLRIAPSGYRARVAAGAGAAKNNEENFSVPSIKNAPNSRLPAGT
jgi:hypothetical protein